MILNDGDKIECEIQGDYIDNAVIRNEGGYYYICQDYKNGSKPQNTYGYKYGWSISCGTECDLTKNGVTNIRIIGSVIGVPITYENWLDKSREVLSQYDIPTDYLMELESKRKISKKLINEILELNEANNYRKLINYQITDSLFKKIYPDTTNLIANLLGNDNYSIVNNKSNITNKNSTKLSKYLTQKLEYLNSDEHVLFQRALNEFGVSYKNTFITNIFDSVKKRNIVISTNIYDMLTSSTNSSYSSCYSMDGEYFNGNISYIRDTFTVISFKYNSDIARKIGRSWVYMFPEQYKILHPTIAYGSMYKDDFKIIRKNIEHAITRFYNVKNYWKYIPNVNYQTSEFSNGRNSSVYFDYTKVGMAYNSRLTNSEKPYIEFLDAICLKCGRITDNSKGGICYDCSSDFQCECCGDWYNEEPAYVGDGFSLCQRCYDDNYNYCDECDQLFHIDDLDYFNGITVCNHCIDNLYTQCDNCGTFIRNEYEHDVDGYSYCDDCFSDLFTTCEECGEVVRRNVINDGKCEECYVKETV